LRIAVEAPIDSLAVIPFENVGGNPDMEYLSDGITESLINSLSRISSLRVVARSRVFRYKDREIDPGQVGRDLNVRALLTGRIAQRGESLRVQTELVEAATEAQLWGERFQRRFVDIFEVEEEIAEQIARNLRLRLSGEEQSSLAGRYKGSSEAYQFFLQGQHHWKKRTGDSLGKALDCFHEAVRLDAHYPAAHEGIARCYLVLAFYNIGQPRPLLVQAKAAAERAVELDPRDPGARATMALLLAWLDWDWQRANAEIQQALRKKADDPQIHDWAAFVFATQGRTRDALHEINTALELDPLALQLQHHAAWFFLLTRQFDQALLQTRKMIELDANYPLAHLWMGAALERLSRYGEAEASCRTALQLFGGGTLPAFESLLGHCLGISGRQREARETLEKLEALSAREYVEPYGLCLIHLGLAEWDKALLRLKQAVDVRSVYSTLQLLSDSRLDPLRGDPRFRELLARTKLG